MDKYKSNKMLQQSNLATGNKQYCHKVRLNILVVHETMSDCSYTYS